MITINDKTICCGCEACVQICPKQCIVFKEDAEGFGYPIVDLTKCIDCGQCEKICHEIHPYEEKTPIKVIAAAYNKKEVRLKSSSGGIFTCLAEKCIKGGGIVFGARFNEEWGVYITETDNIVDLQSLRGSKYVQARVGDSYNKAKAYLESGRNVLFSGTPCQIAGLKHFLRKDYNNLLTVDFVCHGVPSPKVWRLYLEEVKKDVIKNARKGENSVSLSLNPSISECDALAGENGVTIESISFRDKRLGWKKFSFVLTLAKAKADGKSNTVSLSLIHHENPYMKAFLNNMTLRPSCYSCPSKCGRSHADITMADFWGIKKVNPEMDDDIGTSLVLINTEKGETYMPFPEITCEETTYEIAKTCNPPIWRSARCHPKRKHFFNRLDNCNNVTKQIEKELRPPLKEVVVTSLKSVIKFIIGRS